MLKSEIMKLISVASKALMELKGNGGIIGIGSHFAHDLEASNDSDIDLVVIQPSHYLVKKTTLFQGYVFDFTICSLTALRKFCEDSPQKGYWREILRFSEILHDEKGEVSNFLSILESETMDEGLITKKQAKVAKGKIRNILRKINLTGSPVYYFVGESGNLIEHLYHLNCFEAKQKPYLHLQRQYNHMSSDFPLLVKIVEEISSDKKLETKINSISDFCNQTLSTIAAEIDDFGVFKKKFVGDLGNKN